MGSGHVISGSDSLKVCCQNPNYLANKLDLKVESVGFVG